MGSEKRTLVFTPGDTEHDEITPEWLEGMAEGIENEEEDWDEDVRITRVELTVDVPEE